MGRTHATLLAGLWLATACQGTGASVPCEEEALRAALEDALSGDTVVVAGGASGDACALSSPLQVPPGVRLEAEAPGTAFDVREGGSIWLRTDGAAQSPTAVSGFTVRSESGAAVTLTGNGTARLSELTVHAERGLGIVATGMHGLELNRVRLSGPVTADNAASSAFLEVAPVQPDELEPAPIAECSGDPSCTTGDTRPVSCEDCPELTQYCDPCGRWITVTATMGLVLEGVRQAELNDVTIEGFAAFGVVLRSSGSIRWSGGAVRGNLGTGLYADAVDLELFGVELRETLQGFRALPAYAGYVVGGAEGGDGRFQSEDLLVEENEAFGLVQVGATAQHTNLTARNNDDVGLWVSQAQGLVLDGNESLLSGNGFAGLLASDSRDVQVRGATVENTVEKTTTVGGTGIATSLQVGDGIQLIASAVGVALEDVSLANNERVGLVVDVSDGIGGLDFRGVTVSLGQGSAGAVAGDANRADNELMPGAPDGWDEGIERDAAAVAADQGFDRAVDIVGIVMPSSRPGPSDIAGIVMPSS